jgi:hypothetical protein
VAKQEIQEITEQVRSADFDGDLNIVGFLLVITGG